MLKRRQKHNQQEMLHEGKDQEEKREDRAIEDEGIKQTNCRNDVTFKKYVISLAKTPRLLTIDYSKHIYIVGKHLSGFAGNRGHPPTSD